MVRTHFSLLVLFLTAAFCVWAFSGRSVRAVDPFPSELRIQLEQTRVEVQDGDTFHFPDFGIKVRVYGADAPENGQAYSAAARERLAGLLRQGVLECRKTGTSYRRVVMQCSVNNEDIGRRMVDEGLAWHDARFTAEPYRKELTDAQCAAMSAGRGLWRDNNPTPPWEFRKSK